MSGPLEDKQQKRGEHVENIKFSLDTPITLSFKYIAMYLNNPVL